MLQFVHYNSQGSTNGLANSNVLAISQKLGLKLAFLGIDWLTEVTTSGSLRTQYIEPCALLIAQLVLTFDIPITRVSNRYAEVQVSAPPA